MSPSSPLRRSAGQEGEVRQSEQLDGSTPKTLATFSPCSREGTCAQTPQGHATPEEIRQMAVEAEFLRDLFEARCEAIVQLVEIEREARKQDLRQLRAELLEVWGGSGPGLEPAQRAGQALALPIKAQLQHFHEEAQQEMDRLWQNCEAEFEALSASFSKLTSDVAKALGVAEEALQAAHAASEGSAHKPGSQLQDDLAAHAEAQRVLAQMLKAESQVRGDTLADLETKVVEVTLKVDTLAQLYKDDTCSREIAKAALDAELAKVCKVAQEALQQSCGTVSHSTVQQEMKKLKAEMSKQIEDTVVQLQQEMSAKAFASCSHAAPSPCQRADKDALPHKTQQLLSYSKQAHLMATPRNDSLPRQFLAREGTGETANASPLSPSASVAHPQLVAMRACVSQSLTVPAQPEEPLINGLELSRTSSAPPVRQAEQAAKGITGFIPSLRLPSKLTASNIANSMKRLHPPGEQFIAAAVPQAPRPLLQPWLSPMPPSREVCGSFALTSSAHHTANPGPFLARGPLGSAVRSPVMTPRVVHTMRSPRP